MLFCIKDLIYYNFPLAQQPNAGQGRHILEVSRSHTMTHDSRYDSSGRGSGSLQRPIIENTQHSQKSSMPPAGFEPSIPASEQLQTLAIDRSATWIGHIMYSYINAIYCQCKEIRSFQRCIRVIFSCFVYERPDDGLSSRNMQQ